MAKINQSITQQRQKKSFSNIINSTNIQKYIENTLKDRTRAASFTSTLLSVVNGSYQLRDCDAGSILNAALRGEGMNLNLALGQYSIVPYGDKANFQISYKGLSQLAIATMQYKDFGAFDVREGEYKGRDSKRHPKIEWIEDDDEREKRPIIGYYAFYELHNGFERAIYWTYDKVLNHANRYSKAFSLEKYNKILVGEITGKELEKIRRGSPWYDTPDSEAHMKMCKKTVLIQLLNDGVAPLSPTAIRAINMDAMTERGESIAPDFIIDETTGELTELTTEGNEIQPTTERTIKATSELVSEGKAIEAKKTAELGDDGADADAGSFAEEINAEVEDAIDSFFGAEE